MHRLLATGEGIVIHPVCFVNRKAIITLVIAWQILWAICPGWAQDVGERVEGSEFFREAVEKIGPPSQFVWGEAGDHSLNRWQARSQIDLRGVVVSWDSDKLVLIKPDGNGPTNLPGDLVMGFEPAWKSAAYGQVDELFKQQRFREVLQQGQSALSEPGIPRWQQRALVARMVDSAVAIPQYATAGRIFKALAQESPPDLLLSRIPLPWSDELIGVTPSLTQEALGWLDSEIPSLQLLGASWLLGGEHRLKAIEKLKLLSSGGAGLIPAYSKVQLWRLASPEEILSEKYSDWVALRDGLSLPLQAGPTMLLAHRLEQANQPKLAIAEWLRVASMHSDRYHLAVKAQQRGIDAAKKTGDSVFVEKITASFSVLKKSSEQAMASP